ncbi:shugoshin-1-like [Coffea eugenioides]|uniref:Shugoshin C-terminal domain-containing protein n=1 Tax=Coffea arabica TaxID=13443 RepID=A0A6P6U382_COFAR|nr:shugoshin-1-like [Coffea arabica]XP_027184380.1 shugoshin-1-like [Coffea eugenioides]
MKGDRMAKRSSFGSVVRRRLSDITNSAPQPRSPSNVEKPSLDPSSKEYIDHLAKENMALVKLIQDKNKAIELNGIELQKLRINLQKMQMQNWNLAQANSVMIAELNFGKEKMKTLQHEISCKEALLKSRSLEIKEREVIPAEETKLDNSKSRRPRFTRSRSVGHCTTVSHQVAAKEAAENKRLCLRRQSASSKMQQPENKENLFELEDVMLPTAGVPTDFGPASSPFTYKDCKDDKQHGAEHRSRRPERTSIGGRPLRKAAEKVQSYKEVPLNSKMRRAN